MTEILSDRAAAVIIKDHKVLMWWRYKDGVEKHTFPGGTKEPNESIEETLKREVLEEMNLKVMNFEKLYSHTHTYHLDELNKDFQRDQYYFLVTEFTGPIKLGDPELSRQSKDNIYRPDWLTAEELKASLKDAYPAELLRLIIEKL